MMQDHLKKLEHGWFEEFGLGSGSAGLEALSSENNSNTPKFDPISIVIESGIYYITFYGCTCVTNRHLVNGFISWLDMLKSTDVIKMSVLATRSDVPPVLYSNLLAAIKRCKAKIEIKLDTIVFDSLAYFYLASPFIKVGSAGALMIPSYTDKNLKYTTPREQATLSFVSSLVDNAFDRGIISSEDRDNLHSGMSVVVDNEKLKSVSV